MLGSLASLRLCLINNFFLLTAFLYIQKCRASFLRPKMSVVGVNAAFVSRFRFQDKLV